MIAYDFETTRIQAGTPRPLYLTAYGKAPAMHYAAPIRDMQDLHDKLVSEFLREDLCDVKYVAWYGNNFDAYFVAAALITDSRYIIRPYLTRGNSLRGLRIIVAEDIDEKNPRSWEFLDGAAMLGLAGCTLEKLLKNFAPDFLKLTGTINFETEEFDCNNPKHCEYAFRDSEGLWHAMDRAQKIMLQRFNQPLTVTMGGACIKIFKAHIPRDVTISTPRNDVIDLTRSYVMRGGFCFCVRRYHGPVWKYDLNQAYAAAMREADLPCGFTSHSTSKSLPTSKAYIAKIRAVNSRNKIPFYHRSEVNGRLKSCFSVSSIAETWLTSIEIRQLQAEGWVIHCMESYAWDSAFSMTEYIDKLETSRTTCEGGPNGPIGTMIKATGNHSYGKTVEVLEPVEYLMAPECPPGYEPFYGDDLQPFEHVYFRFVEEQKPKDYHQPQIGAFITSYVRMVVRRAALLAPDEWLYADTDCVIFSKDVTDKLDIDSKRYGAWKIEESGTEYRIIAKKVYTEIGEAGAQLSRSSKGLNTKKLAPQDFERWYDGTPPEQQQTQRQNFLVVMRGGEMYRTQKRRGTAVEVNKG